MSRFIGLPISIFLYWLILRPKKDNPFPKWCIVRLVIAAVVSCAVSSVLSLPLEAMVTFLRVGSSTDLRALAEAIKTNPNTIKEFMATLNPSMGQRAFWSIVGNFFGAGLLEEGLKFITCRLASRKKGMIHTWMDCVICFAFVGVTFELIENMAFGGSEDLLFALLRALASAHFAFGTFMGYYYGKFRVTGKKRYLALCFFGPVIYHSVVNGLMSVSDPTKLFVIIGNTAAISYIVIAVLAVIMFFRWHKTKELDVPVKKVRAQH